MRRYRERFRRRFQSPFQHVYGRERGPLYRSNDRVLSGVCAGLAERMDLNPWGVRLVWVMLSLVGLVLPMIIIYMVLAVFMKPQPMPPPPIPGMSGGPGEPRRHFFSSRAEILMHLQARFERLDKRLQRMESIVTRPSFGKEEEYANL